MIMSELERMTVTLTPELARLVRDSASGQDYASASEIVREALREWRDKRHDKALARQYLRDAIASGLDDHAQGQVESFDAEALKAAGRAALRRTG
jgi:antitoxin ParD1/3/4